MLLWTIAPSQNPHTNRIFTTLLDSEPIVIMMSVGVLLSRCLFVCAVMRRLAGSASVVVVSTQGVVRNLPTQRRPDPTR